MQSLFRWGTVLGLVGSTLIAPSIAGKTAAIAMPESEVLKRMEGVPFFTVTNTQGLPILASLPSQKDKSKTIQVATFFESQKDAQSLVTKLKSSNPKIGNAAKVVPVSLRQAYELARKNKDNKDNVAFQFLPEQQELSSALAILKQNGQKVEQFNGIPLFYASESKSKGLLTIESNKSKMIPFYFDKQDLQGMLSQLKEQNPKLAASTKIEVTSLAQIVDSMIKQNGEGIQQITLVPSKENLDYVIKQQSQAKPTAPAQQAAPKK